MEWTSTVSIVIPVHKGGRKFRQCLKSVALLTPPPLEIIVVVDGEYESARTAGGFDARVIQLDERHGPAHARNVGATHARGDIVLFIDADVAVPADLLSHLDHGFNTAPPPVAVIGSYDCRPASPGVVSQYKNLLHHFVHQQANEDAATFWGACGAMRRDVFLSMGGFDERYNRPCVEDIDLGYRLRMANYPIRLLKTLTVTHLKQWSLMSLLKSDLLDRAVPWTELILRYRMFRNDLNLRHSDRLSVILIYLVLVSATIGIGIPWLYVAAIGGMTLIVFLNLPLYKFLVAQRGAVFMIPALGLHWFSLLYSGVGFIMGSVLHYLLRLRRFFTGQDLDGGMKTPTPHRHPLVSTLRGPAGGGN